MPRGGKRPGAGRPPGIKGRLNLIPRTHAGKREVAELARQHVDEAFAALLDAMESDNRPASVQAASLILAYAFGRPAQQLMVAKVNLSGEMSDSELLDALNELRIANGLEPYPRHPFKVIEGKPVEDVEPEKPVEHEVNGQDKQSPAVQVSPRRGLPWSVIGLLLLGHWFMLGWAEHQIIVELIQMN